MPAAEKSQIGRRYARALAGLVQTEKDFHQVEKDLEAFCDLLRERSDLRLALRHPSLSPGRRVDLLHRVLDRSRLTSSWSRRLLTLMVERGRLELLEVTLALWRSFMEEKLGIVTAEVTTAHPLTREERASFRKTLEKITGCRIRMQTRTDSALIGGARARIGSRVYDGSILRQLNLLRETFAEGS